MIQRGRPFIQRRGHGQSSTGARTELRERRSALCGLHCCEMQSGFLLWGNHAALVAITALGAGALGVILETKIALGVVSHWKTVAAVFYLLSALYFLTAHSSGRLRHWHSVVEQELQALEPDGYFHKRSGGGKAGSASSWLIRAYFALSAVCFLAGLGFTF